MLATTQTIPNKPPANEIFFWIYKTKSLLPTSTSILSNVIHFPSSMLKFKFHYALMLCFTRNLTSVPHLAGTEQDFEQAEWLRTKFLEFGLDQATVVPYNVLLSYPDMKIPNKVYLLDSNGNANFTTTGRQPPLFAPEEGSPLASPNFNAYSGTGTVTSVKTPNACYYLIDVK